MPSFCVTQAINKMGGGDLRVACGGCRPATLDVSAAWVFVVGLNESTTPPFN